MSENLPILPPDAGPAEYIQISPEALEVANCYLQVQDIRQVAEQLEISVDLVSDLLGRREVKAYVDHVYLDTGFNNRYKMRRAMDAIIAKKFQEMEEADTGSNKDILEILALSHKMTMDQMDKQLQLEKIRAERGGPKTQVNVQVNNEGGSNYDRLLNKLMGQQNA
jgi:hypothetical protein